LIFLLASNPVEGTREIRNENCVNVPGRSPIVLSSFASQQEP